MIIPILYDTSSSRGCLVTEAGAKKFDTDDCCIIHLPVASPQRRKLARKALSLAGQVGSSSGGFSGAHWGGGELHLVQPLPLMQTSPP